MYFADSLKSQLCMDTWLLRGEGQHIIHQKKIWLKHSEVLVVETHLMRSLAELCRGLDPVFKCTRRRFSHLIQVCWTWETSKCCRTRGLEDWSWITALLDEVLGKLQTTATPQIIPEAFLFCSTQPLLLNSAQELAPGFETHGFRA